MKPFRLTVELHLSPSQVKKLIDIACETVIEPSTLSDLDRRQLARRGVRTLIHRNTRKAKNAT